MVADIAMKYFATLFTFYKQYSCTVIKVSKSSQRDRNGNQHVKVKNIRLAFDASPKRNIPELSEFIKQY